MCSLLFLSRLRFRRFIFIPDTLKVIIYQWNYCTRRVRISSNDLLSSENKKISISRSFFGFNSLLLEIIWRDEFVIQHPQRRQTANLLDVVDRAAILTNRQFVTPNSYTWLYFLRNNLILNWSLFYHFKILNHA